MVEWWNSLSSVMKILWAITLSASLIFIIQSIMTFLGAGAGSDFDTDADTSGMDAPDTTLDGADGADAAHGTGMGLLTFRNFVNFIIGFGWSAILLHDAIPSTTLLMIIAIVVGVALVFLVMMLFRWLGSMQQSGNINVFKTAVGCEGKVYLTIPAERKGTGKVQIAINESVREYDAVTDGPALPTGSSIRVVEAIGSDTLLVEAIESIII
jgi:uncharacterized membrane protein